MAECFGNIVLSDMWAAEFLDPETIRMTFVKMQHENVVPADFVIPLGLRIVAVVAPFAGLAAFGVLLWHVHLIIQNGAEFKKGPRPDLPYFPNERQDMVLLVVVLPAVFIILAVRSASRMMMAMRGWDHNVPLDKALFYENFEFANICQYIVVLEFVLLCSNIMFEKIKNKEVADMFSKVGFLGAGAWVVVGVLQSIVLFWSAFLGANLHKIHGAAKFKHYLDNSFEKIGPIFATLTALCVLNMMVICKVKEVKEALTNPDRPFWDANKKFLGTRALLLLAQFQLKGVQWARNNRDSNKIAAYLDLSEFRGNLWHASLLSIECLAVILINFYAWGYRLHYLYKTKETQEQIEKDMQRAAQEKEDALREQANA